MIKKLVTLSLVSVCLLSGCAIVDIREDIEYSYQGGQVAKPLFTQVVPGVTNKQWLLENFGEPVVEITEESGDLEMTYQYEEFVNTKTRILFLFYYRSSKIIPRQFVVALKDDLVTRVGPSYFESTEE